MLHTKPMPLKLQSMCRLLLILHSSITSFPYSGYIPTVHIVSFVSTTAYGIQPCVKCCQCEY